MARRDRGSTPRLGIIFLDINLLVYWRHGGALLPQGSAASRQSDGAFGLRKKNPFHSLPCLSPLILTSRELSLMVNTNARYNVVV